MTEWDVFIAHAGQDAAEAEELYDLLHGRCRVFVDSRSVELGVPWDMALPEAQRSSRYSVILISSRSGEAYYVAEEIAQAIELARTQGESHRVVPVYLDGSRETLADVPYGLRRLHGMILGSDVTLQTVAERLLGELTAPPGRDSGVDPTLAAHEFERYEPALDQRERQAGLDTAGPPRWRRPWWMVMGGAAITLALMSVVVLAWAAGGGSNRTGLPRSAGPDTDATAAGPALATSGDEPSERTDPTTGPTSSSSRSSSFPPADMAASPADTDHLDQADNRPDTSGAGDSAPEDSESQEITSPAESETGAQSSGEATLTITQPEAEAWPDSTFRVTFSTNLCTIASYSGAGQSYVATGWPDVTGTCYRNHGQTFSGVAAGSYTITVRARSAGGQEATRTVDVTIPGTG